MEGAVGKVDDMRALREARYGRQRERRPVGLASREPAREEKARPAPPAEITSDEQDHSPAAIEPASVESVHPQGKAALQERSVTDRSSDGPPRPIQSFSSEELEDIVADLYSPGMTCDQMTDAVVSVLRFQRRGKVIKARVKEAYDAVIERT